MTTNIEHGTACLEDRMVGSLFGNSVRSCVYVFFIYVPCFGFEDNSSVSVLQRTSTMTSSGRKVLLFIGTAQRQPERSFRLCSLESAELAIQSKGD